jgi:hypothetical protein
MIRSEGGCAQLAAGRSGRFHADDMKEVSGDIVAEGEEEELVGAAQRFLDRPQSWRAKRAAPQSSARHSFSPIPLASPN